MAKTAVPVNFAGSLDTKSDPNQVPMGKFLSLENSIFDEIGALKKRNGFDRLTNLPSPATYLTTFNGALTAIGPTLQAFTPASAPWVQVGGIQPLSLNTLPVIRNSLNQIQSDSVVAPNGLGCVVYTESDGSGLSYKYSIFDSTTGQIVVKSKLIPSGSGTVTGSPRVFLLGAYFVIVFTNVISAVNHLQYISVSTVNPLIVTSPTDIASNYVPSAGLSWDGVAYGNRLYLAYDNITGGQSIKVTYLSELNAASGGGPASPTTYTGSKCTLMSMCTGFDSAQSPIIYAAFYDLSSTNGFIVALDQNINKISGPTAIITSLTVYNITCAAQSSSCFIFYEVNNNYTYDTAIPSHFTNVLTYTVSGGASSTLLCARSLGLASKAFVFDSQVYFLGEYQSAYQPTYFLINGSKSAQGNVVVAAKLAYGNGYQNPSGATQGYLPLGLPSVTVNGSEVVLSYLFKDLIEAVNKATTGIDSTAQNPLQTANIYSQTGINLGFFTFGTSAIDSTEIGSNLNITGGFLAAYDGTQVTEQNFFLWPDNVEATWSTTGGAIVAQPDAATNTKAYWYQTTYEWADNQGNVQRSAPSIPIFVTTTGTASTGSITLKVPYYRFTYKTNVKIVIYRWSLGQQVYFQSTSITQPQLNNPVSDFLTYVDTLSDASILGGNILYTTGGVVENINAPASDLMTLFDDRLWLVDSENRNLLLFSKQVIESTPVEMSDLFTFYVAPTIGSQGSTGVITALSVMDDKLIIFKKNAIYYINGTGPDNTGSNNQYNGPIFITTTTGSILQKSIVLTPSGLMFQSDKGIWLLNRTLGIEYIGAPVEAYTQDSIALSAVGIPGTNQIRFTMDSGKTLMFDYYVSQWGTFTGIAGISSTLYQDLHTYVDSYGRIFQETPGVYLDDGNSVLLSFVTGWLGVGGLRGYQRIYEYSFQGKYFSPHKAYIQTAYDYGPSEHQAVYSPPNYAPPYGSNLYGSGLYGGFTNVESFRVQTKRQLCKAMQISFQEIFDPSFGAKAGAGIELSGINLVVQLKKGYAPVAARNSVG